jgi:hypothetical protein
VVGELVLGEAQTDSACLEIGMEFCRRGLDEMEFLSRRKLPM